MIEIGTLTLFREKSTVYQFVELADDETPHDEPVLQVKSNRVTIPVKTKVSTVAVVVRGHNIPGTMRMAATVLDEVRRDANLLVGGGNVDWDSQWRRRVSKYENDFVREAWVSVHIAGTQVFSSRSENAAVQTIESLCPGEEVTDSVVLETAQNVLSALDDFAVEHDSQTAFVMTPGPQYHRASILERRDRKTGAVSMSVYHPTPQQPVRLSHFLGFCADVMEVMTHKSFLDRVQEMAAENTLTKSGISPTHIAAARARRKDVIQAIENFEQVNRVVYRPDRPNFA